MSWQLSEQDIILRFTKKNKEESNDDEDYNELEDDYESGDNIEEPEEIPEEEEPEEVDDMAIDAYEEEDYE